MTPPQFLVVEYDGAGLPFVDWSQGRPSVHFDMILNPPQTRGSDVQLPGIALVQGLDADGLRELEELLKSTYAPWSTLRRDVARGEWLGRITIHLANIHAPAARAVSQYAHRLGPPWSHVEDRIVYMRMRIPDGTDGPALAAEVEQEIRDSGAEAQVTVESYSAHDYGVWDRLVQSSIGLNP